MHRSAIITRSTRLLGALLARFGVVVRGAAFWTAAVLPLAYLPLVLVAPVTAADLWLLATLLPVNVLALVVGHGHGDVVLPPGDGTD